MDATALRTPVEESAPAEPSRGGPRITALRGGPLGWIVLALLPASVLGLFWRTWQQLFAFDRGLDATLPGFGRYWLSIFFFNVLVLPTAAAAWFAWLWLSGRHMAAEFEAGELDEATEVRRIWGLWILLLGFAMAAWWGGSYFTEQDAAWHQVTLRDTAFTPSHISLFYGAFPLMVYGATGSFLYARSRLPHIFGGRALPLPFVLMISGTVLLLFQVAFNEFGHTFWETEEIFNAPLHWPFVFFAYFLASTFAVVLQTLPRLLELTRSEQRRSGRTAPGLLAPLGRRWDLVAALVIVLILAAAMHMESTLFAGEWSFWADWKDRQWWPLVTPAANMILVGTAQYALWRRFRLPVGATLAATVLVVTQLVSRTATFALWANLPFNFTWPETMVLLGVLLDVTLLLSRSYVITSLVGGLLWGGLFWWANLPLLVPFHQAVVVEGQVLTVADWMAFQFPRSQGPEYLRMIEQGHLRALVGNVTAIVAFFAAMLSAATWWVGVGIARVLLFRPIGRFVHIQTDTGEPTSGEGVPA